jgi:hypothetical protein
MFPSRFQAKMQGESRAKAVRFARMYAIVHKNMTYITSRRGGSMSDMIGVFNAYNIRKT